MLETVCQLMMRKVGNTEFKMLILLGFSYEGFHLAEWPQNRHIQLKDCRLQIWNGSKVVVLRYI